MGTKIDRKKRYVVRQILHSNNVQLHTLQHELWRVKSVEHAGLTEKEREFIEKRLTILKKVSEDLTKLGTHLNGSL